MATKFTVHAELTASDLASPVIKRARDAFSDLGTEANASLRAAGVRVRDFAQEIEKLEKARATLKAVFEQGKISAAQYQNALAQVEGKQERLNRVMHAGQAPAKGFAGALGSVGTALGGLLVAGAAAASAALVGVISTMRDAVKAASEAELQNVALEASLAKLGPKATALTGALESQARALGQASLASEKEVKSVQALLASLGVAPEKLQKATQATLDYAAALGVDLEAAARNVGKTVSGTAGELGELVPELRGMTAEALRNSDAIDVLAQKYEGRASAAAGTYAVAIDRVAEAQERASVAFGKALTESEEAKKGTDRLARSYEGLASVLERGTEDVGFFASKWLAFKAALVETAQIVVGDVLPGVRALIGATKEAGEAAEEAAAKQEKVLSVEERIAAQRKAVTDASKGYGIVLRDLAKEQADLIEIEQGYVDLLRTETGVSDEAVLKRRALTLAIEGTRAKLAEVRGETDLGATSLTAHGEASREAAAGTRELNGELGKVANQARATTAAVNATRVAVQQLTNAFGQTVNISRAINADGTTGRLLGFSVSPRQVGPVSVFGAGRRVDLAVN